MSFVSPALTLTDVALRIGGLDAKLDGIIAELDDQGRRLRNVEDASIADRAVASRVAQMRADGTITKRWVIQIAIAIVVAAATVGGLIVAFVR